MICDCFTEKQTKFLLFECIRWISGKSCFHITIFLFPGKWKISFIENSFFMLSNDSSLHLQSRCLFWKVRNQIYPAVYYSAWCMITQRKVIKSKVCILCLAGVMHSGKFICYYFSLSLETIVSCMFGCVLIVGKFYFLSKDQNSV